MLFEDELDAVLPQDIPHRSRLIEKSTEHVSLILAANESMNLTRISNPREAAVKHVLDSVLPWTFFKQARRIVDAGTGAGFPGIPLSIVLPEARFVLSESIGKKARFVDSAVESLALPNVTVSSERAEMLVQGNRPEIVTARAVAPLHRLVPLFRKALLKGTRLLLYKGPDVASELADVQSDSIRAEVVFRYELPYELGSRTLVSLSAQERGLRAAS